MGLVSPSQERSDQLAHPAGVEQSQDSYKNRKTPTPMQDRCGGNARQQDKGISLGGSTAVLTQPALFQQGFQLMLLIA